MPRTIDGKVWLSMAEVAAAAGESVRKVRYWLTRAGAAVQHGRHWYTTRRLLRDAFPEAWDEIVAKLPR